MKKHLCMAVAACGLLSLASCSDDENVIMNDQPVVETGEQVITLNVQSTDVLSTKSRPLYSTENKGAGEVTDVALLIFKMSEDNDGYPMTLDQVIKISRWDQLATEYGPNANVDYGHKYTIELGKDYGSTKLEAGSDYTIIAVGQNESNEEVLPPYKISVGEETASLISAFSTVAEISNKNWNASTTAGNGYLLTSAEGIDRYGEIFSGTSKPVHLNLTGDDEDGGFNAEVLLKRQVAGVIGYFSQIPAYAEVEGTTYATKKIRLVASAKNTQIDLTRLLSEQSDDATGEGKTESIVNGFSPAEADAKYEATDGDTNDAYVVYEIDLKDWFVPASPVDGEDAETSPEKYWGINTDDYSTSVAILGAEGTGIGWKNAIDGANAHPRVLDNAVLAGEFVVPFFKDDTNGKNTFELQLIGGADDNPTILKKWNVRLDDNSASEGDGDYLYSIYRNHLYQIGQRNGGDDPEPGTDGDDPQPLDGSQDLVIKINDNWEIIHDMVIE